MGLYQWVKRILPNQRKDRWKARFYSTRTLPEDIVVRALNRLRSGIPLPRGELIYLVSGHRSASRFLRRGRVACKTIRETLKKNGVEIEHLNAILDFGCGVGRIMRHWDPRQHPVLHGTDCNPRLVAWCTENLKFAEFQVNTLSDRLPYEAETFDFIYAFSVFTHLGEPLQSFWINELSIVLKPGGYIYFTTHGNYFFPQLMAEEKEGFLNGRLVVREAKQSGSNMCATYHPTTFVRENMARDFSLVDFIPGRPEGDILHDIYLLKKPARASMKSLC